jgi:hypothetical protein
MLIVLVFSCKKKQNNNNLSERKDNNSNNVEIFKDVIVPNYPLWTLNRLLLKEANSDHLIFENKKVFEISRISTRETAYASVNNIAVIYGKDYRVSLIVKQGSNGSLFGLRLIGEYPNRADTIFDLKKGLVKEVVDFGDFINAKASIEALSNGWYICNLTAEVNTDKIKIILGPTFELGKTSAWEAPTKEKCNNYIIPSSLKLEEVYN